jgi:hypothetical protein
MKGQKQDSMMNSEILTSLIQENSALSGQRAEKQQCILQHKEEGIRVPK